MQNNKLDNTIEPLCDPANDRFAIFPISYDPIWKLYKHMQSMYWKAEEIDLSNDYTDMMALPKEEQHIIRMILAFFANADGIVNFNIRKRFLDEFKVPEVQVAYSWQQMIENIHNEMYSLMLMNLIKDTNERNELFNAVNTVPSIKLMKEWAFKWIDDEKATIGHRLIASACTELIFFGSSFLTIFWLKKYRNGGKNILNGLVKSNQFIARDETTHGMMGCMLYGYVVNKLQQQEVYDIVTESVEIAKVFAKDVIQGELIGMNITMMNEYIEYIADRLLVMLQYNKYYNTINPYPFMEAISLIGKNNFFEARSTEYTTAHTSENVTRSQINLLEDF